MPESNSVEILWKWKSPEMTKSGEKMLHWHSFYEGVIYMKWRFVWRGAFDAREKSWRAYWLGKILERKSNDKLANFHSALSIYSLRGNAWSCLINNSVNNHQSSVHLERLFSKDNVNPKYLP